MLIFPQDIMFVLAANIHSTPGQKHRIERQNKYIELCLRITLCGGHYQLVLLFSFSFVGSHCTGWRLNIGQGGTVTYNVALENTCSRVCWRQAYQEQEDSRCAKHDERHPQRLKSKANNKRNNLV